MISLSGHHLLTLALVFLETIDIFFEQPLLSFSLFAALKIPLITYLSLIQSHVNNIWVVLPNSPKPTWIHATRYHI